MVAAKNVPGLATLADLLAIPEQDRYHEIIDGELIRKEAASPWHGQAQVNLIVQMGSVFGKQPGGRNPGDWWFLSEVEIEFGTFQILRPDIAGWRRERMSTVPNEFPLQLAPDWVCEIVSPSSKTNDTIKKVRIYHTFHVPHYWIVDPMEQTLTVYRWHHDGYLLLLRAERGERVRAEPFAAKELQVGVLFGEEAVDTDSSG